MTDCFALTDFFPVIVAGRERRNHKNKQKLHLDESDESCQHKNAQISTTPC